MYSVKEQSHNDFEQTVEYGDSTDLLSNTIASISKEKWWDLKPISHGNMNIWLYFNFSFLNMYMKTLINYSCVF